jgi:hypothetical protein
VNRVSDYLRATPSNYVKPLGALALVYGITHTVAVLGIKAWIASQKQESKPFFIERYRLQVIDQTSTIRLLLRPLTVIKALASLRFPPPSASDPTSIPALLSAGSQGQPSNILTKGVEGLKTQHKPETQEPALAPVPIHALSITGSQKQPSEMLKKLVEELKTQYKYIPVEPPSQDEIQALEAFARSPSRKYILRMEQELAQKEAEVFHALREQLTVPSPSVPGEELTYALGGLDIFIRRTSFEPTSLQSLWKAIGVALIVHRRYPDLVLDLRALFDFHHPEVLKEPLTSRALLTAVAQRKEPYDILNRIQNRAPEEKPSEETLRFLSEFTDTLPASPCQSGSASPSREDPLIGACVKLLGAAKNATKFDELCSTLIGMLSNLEDTLSLPGLPLLKWALFLKNDNNLKKVSLMTALGFMAYRVSPHIQVPCQIFSQKLPKEVAAGELLANTANGAKGYLFLANVGRKPKDSLLQEALAFLAPFKTTAPEPEHRDSPESGPGVQ